MTDPKIIEALDDALDWIAHSHEVDAKLDYEGDAGRMAEYLAQNGILVCPRYRIVDVLTAFVTERMADDTPDGDGIRRAAAQWMPERIGAIIQDAPSASGTAQVPAEAEAGTSASLAEFIWQRTTLDHEWSDNLAKAILDWQSPETS